MGSGRYSVHLDLGSYAVEIYPLPELLPDTPEGMERMMTPLATGSADSKALHWTTNSIGTDADLAADWTIHHVDEASRLLLFVDETGTEDLSDPNYPVFGLGGCAIRAEDYRQLVAGPWRVMKFRHFGGLEVPLHAAALRPTSTQVQAIGEVFRTAQFHRLAAVASTSTRIGAAIASVYQGVGTMLLRNLAALLNRIQCSGVTTVFEASERGDRLAKAFFPLVRANNGAGELPLRWGSMSKAAGEPGLEVADFIMHAAGTQVRAHQSGKKGYRKDFQAVFQAQQHLAHFSEMISVDVVRNPAGTINAVLIDPTSIIVGKRE